MSSVRFLQALSAQKVKEGLKNALSDVLGTIEPRLLADGFSSYVFCLDDELILRVAKTSEAQAKHSYEFELLHQIHRHLSVQLPIPQRKLEASEVFPFGAILYTKIQGRPWELKLSPQVDLEQIAKDIAQFLYELHRLKPELKFLKENLDLLWQTVQPALELHLPEHKYQKAKRWQQAFAQNLYKKVEVLVHGDIWAENIILDERLTRVRGIVDFELSAFGDSAQDFSAHHYVSLDFQKKVIARYQDLGGELGESFDQRIRDWTVIRELRGLSYALCYPEAHEFEDSLSKVASLW